MIFQAPDDGANHEKDVDNKETNTESKFSRIQEFTATITVLHKNDCFLRKQCFDCSIIIDVDDNIDKHQAKEHTETDKKEDSGSVGCCIQR